MKFLLLPLLFSMIILLLGQFLKKKIFYKKEKNSPFECGFDPFSLSRTPFSLRFFMISIIFLIFDIEIIIILPIPIINQFSSFYIYLNIILIIFIIFIGLIYEWKNGMLEWLK
nr:NADH dehydrogenase subunit 3 [Carios vespertilionis]